MPEFSHRGVEGRKAAVNTGLKNCALDGTEHESRKSVTINGNWEAISSVVEVATNTFHPIGEELGDALPNQGVALGELCGKSAERRPEGEIIGHQVPSRSLHDSDDSFEWIRGMFFGPAKDLVFEELTDVVDDCQQEVVLGGKEVIEAAAGCGCPLHDLVDTRLGITLPPEELGCGGNEPFSSVRSTWQQTFSRVLAEIN